MSGTSSTFPSPSATADGSIEATLCQMRSAREMNSPSATADGSIEARARQSGQSNFLARSPSATADGSIEAGSFGRWPEHNGGAHRRLRPTALLKRVRPGGPEPRSGPHRRLRPTALLKLLQAGRYRAGEAPLTVGYGRRLY